MVNRGSFSWNRALGVVKQRQSGFRAIPPRALILLALVVALLIGLAGCNGCPTQEEIDSIAVTLTTVSDASATAVVGATTTVPVETTTTATTRSHHVNHEDDPSPGHDHHEEDRRADHHHQDHHDIGE